MIDLKCKCKSCKYNKNCMCDAKEINVDRQTSCETYREDYHKNKAEYAEEIVQPLVKRDISVKCNAKCLFNNSNLCIANGITVMNENNLAECSTFLPK